MRAVLKGGPLDGFTDTLVDADEPPPVVTVDWCDRCVRRHLYEVALEDVDVDPVYVLDDDQADRGLAVYRYLDFDEQLDNLLELAAVDFGVSLPALTYAAQLPL